MIDTTTGYFADFGVSATLAGAAVTGIFDNAAAHAFNGLMLGTNPTFTLVTAAGHARGQSLVVSGVTYTVAAVEPDGTGMTVLQLEAA
jgi:shikimate kinase